MIRKTLKRLGLGLCFCVALILIANIVGALWPRSLPRFASESRDVTVYLVAGPIHYDFVLPLTPDVRVGLADVVPDDETAQHLLIGWGSKAFYTTAGAYEDVEARAVWTAITGDAAVLRVDHLAAFDWERYGALRLTMTADQFAALLAFVAADFERNSVGAVMPIEGAGFGVTDQFYAAQGRFHAGRTCNIWVADALQAAGVRVGAWTPTPVGLKMSLRYFSSVE